MILLLNHQVQSSGNNSIEWRNPLGIGLRGCFCGFEIICEKENIIEHFSDNCFKSKVIDNNVHSTNEILYLLTNAAVGKETEVKEVVTKRGEYVKNPDTGKYNIIYNESVEMVVEVPIKISDRLKAHYLLGKYHVLFTDKKEMTGNTPFVIEIGEWDGEELDKEIK